MDSKLVIQQLLRAAQSEQDDLPAGKTTRDIVATLGFGRIQGRRWVISAGDQERIRAYLRDAEGIDPSTPPDAWKDASRIEAAHLGENEKLAARRPRDGRVALRAPGTLHINGMSLRLPPGSFLDIPGADVQITDHDCLIVIENFEAFLAFESAVIALPYRSPVLAYRGDSTNSPEASHHLAQTSPIPVLVWPDYDPAGLAIAQAVPNAAGIIAPAEPQTALAAHGRSSLFLQQLTQINGLRQIGEWCELETVMRELRRGLDQERMIAKGVPGRVWGMGAQGDKSPA